MFNTISSVDPGSRLEGRVLPGDELRYINRHEIHDVLDYKYWAYDRSLTLEFRDAGTIRLRKKEGEDLGLNFETYLMDKPTGCSNRCIFCFIDQLPRGLRKTLYFKDDDARLSFLTGNYITCTNLSERELQRICDLKVSPAEHFRACDRSGAARKAHRQPARQRDHGHSPPLRRGGHIHGMPDRRRPRLERRRGAAALAGGSCGALPACEQRFHRAGRSHLPPRKAHALSPYTPEQARATIAQVESFAAECFEKYGSHIFYCSDEMYLRAGLPLPEDEYYEDYAQLENGVGMLRLLETEFDLALSLEDEADRKETPRFSIATGKAAEPYLRALLEKVGANGTVYGIPNDFFGHTIEVAGLLTGQDIIRHLRDKDIGERVYIPKTMLRHGEGVFLDDLTPEDVSRELGVPVIPLEVDGAELLAAMRFEEL